MATDALITIDDTAVLNALAKYAVVAGKTMREVLYEEWPFLIRKVMDFTPPFATRASRGPDKLFATSASDLSVGRKAVANDIYKTMRPFDPAKIRSESLRKIVEGQKVSAFNAMAARVKTGPMAGARATFFDRAIHTKQRNARGRVTGRDRNVVVLGDGAKLLNRYVKEMQDRVGYAKSGWLKALLLTGGTAPAYVMKQGTVGGTVIDDHANEDFPSITAINHTPWAVRQDEGERALADAKASRISAIESKVMTKLRLAAKEAKLAA